VKRGDGAETGVGGSGVFHRATAELHHDRAVAVRADPLDGGRKRSSGNTKVGHPGRPNNRGKIGKKHRIPRPDQRQQRQPLSG
jgi:hypothetical protein